MTNSFHIAVIGLGYVGLPLALALSKKMSVVGFDISGDKIQNLQEGIAPTEIASAQDHQKLICPIYQRIISIREMQFLYCCSSNSC